MTTEHVHDCTGPDLTCACGFVFSVLPISVCIDIADSNRQVTMVGFNTNTIAGAIAALRREADRLERTELPRAVAAVARTDGVVAG